MSKNIEEKSGTEPAENKGNNDQLKKPYHHEPGQENCSEQDA